MVNLQNNSLIAWFWLIEGLFVNFKISFDEAVNDRSGAPLFPLLSKRAKHRACEKKASQRVDYNIRAEISFWNLNLAAFIQVNTGIMYNDNRRSNTAFRFCLFYNR